MLRANILNPNPAGDRGPGREPKRARMPASRPAPDGIDRLSRLPGPLLHQIMSLLPNEDAIHMSVLSKYHHAAWRSHPAVEFEYRTWARRSGHGPLSALRFSEHIRASLQRREPGPNDLERFRLQCLSFLTNDYHTWSAVLHIGRFLMDHCVRDLVIDCGGSNLCGLPGALFSGNPSARRIVLSGFDLSPTDLLVEAPRLEEVRLTFCHVGRVVRLSSPRLRTASFSDCTGRGTRIQIEGSRRSLESFSYNGNRTHRFRISNLSSCEKLKTLELQRLNMTDEWFRVQVSKLPSVESLHMKNCLGPKNLYMRSDSLGEMEMVECTDVEMVHVAARNLHSFSYSRVGYERECKITLGECENMRVLELKGAAGTVTQEWVQANLARLERLERLVLAYCNRLGDFRLHSPQLQRLELVRCKDLRSFEVWAPSLTSFLYEGKLSFSPPAVVHSSQVNAEIRFYNFSRNDSKNLRDFLSFFGHCKTLTLCCYRDERFIFPFSDRLKMSSPLFDLNHLKIKVAMLYVPAIELIESALWLAPHPQTLRITLNAKPYVTMQFHYNAPGNLRFPGDEFCCRASPVCKCWRHSVTEIGIAIFPSFKESWETLVNFFARNASFPVIIRRVTGIRTA